MNTHGLWSMCIATNLALTLHRYMASGDAFVHADIPGAPVTIVKNHVTERAVSPLALTQAGSCVVCRSKAWDSKAVVSAWWAQPASVCKAAPTGELRFVLALLVCRSCLSP